MSEKARNLVKEWMDIPTTIQQVVVVTREGVGITQIGSNGVAKIQDESKEWEGGIDFIFRAYDKNGKLLKEIINCPVDITYA